ncbi:hypothetical protein V2J09_007110 [Rumex salicifolius]
MVSSPLNRMLMLYSIFLRLVHPTLSLSISTRSPAAAKSIFILAGQSNMAGRGGVLNDTHTGVPTWDGFVPYHCRPTSSILRLDAHLRWVEAREPIHHDIDYNKTCGVGPGMPFAHTLLGHHPGQGPVGLVPCAIGGTSINQWARGTPLYRHMIRRARASARDGGIIEAVIWFQGESDTENEADATSYGQKLLTLFSDWRTDLQDPLLPIILVAIASGEGPFIQKVREAQLDISLLNVIVVDAMGLPLGPDHLHLTTQAQVHLGEKLGRALLKFLPSPVQRNVAQNASPSTHNLHSSHIVWTCIVGVILVTLF